MISSSPRAEGDGADGLVHGRGEEVDADQGQIALGVRRLLLQARDPPVRVQLRDAEGARVGHLGQQDLGVRAGGPELVDQIGDPADDEVVAQIHHEVVLAEELAGDQHRVGQAQRRVLRDVGDGEAEPRAVADGRPDLFCRVPDDDADVRDPGGRDRLQPVEQHRFVGHRHQLFRRGVGDRPQPGAGAAGEDECFHWGPPESGRRGTGSERELKPGITPGGEPYG